MDSEDEEWLKAFNKKKVMFIHHVHLLVIVYQLTTRFCEFTGAVPTSWWKDTGRSWKILEITSYMYL